MPQKARSPRNITIPDFCKSRAASASDHKPHSSRLLSRLLRQGPRLLHDPLPVPEPSSSKAAETTNPRKYTILFALSGILISACILWFAFYRHHRVDPPK